MAGHAVHRPYPRGFCMMYCILLVFWLICSRVDPPLNILSPVIIPNVVSVIAIRIFLFCLMVFRYSSVAPTTDPINAVLDNVNTILSMVSSIIIVRQSL